MSDEVTKTGEIRFKDGAVHRCSFGPSDWVGTHEPPWQKGEDGLYHPIPGVDHRYVMKNTKTGETRDV